MNPEFRFLHPELLWLLLLVPLLLLWRARRGRGPSLRYTSLEPFVQKGSKIRSRAGFWLSLLRGAVLALLIIVMARPQTGRTLTEMQASGIDIMLAIDISGSMEARDFAIHGQQVSRLEVVQSVVKKFIDDRPYDRIGIVAFAGEAYLMSPLTLDHDALQERLKALRISMAQDGTAIGSGITTATARLIKQKAKSKIVILLTDGVNNAGKILPITAAQAAQALGVKVYTIGAGAEGEAPIQVENKLGRKQWMRMKFDIDEETMQRIAETTGGRYFHATDTDSLRRIYEEINQLEKSKHSYRKLEEYHEIFAQYLIPAMLLLFLEIILTQTVWRRWP